MKTDKNAWQHEQCKCLSCNTTHTYAELKALSWICPITKKEVSAYSTLGGTQTFEEDKK